MRRDQIALQLYTLRKLMATDLPGTLQAVAATGYRAVELAALPETRPGELARLLSDAGLTVMASHESIDRLRDDANAVADRLAEVGCPMVIVPWLPENDRRTVDEVRTFAEILGGFARRFAQRGIRLAYHNHAFEFLPFGNTTIWDILLAELPPEVELELDAYWVVVGGRDPVAEIRAAAKRVRMIHMKDLAPGKEPHDAPAGSGILPFPEIIEEARAAGVDWYVAEQDDPRDPLVDVASALRYLESLAI